MIFCFDITPKEFDLTQDIWCLMVYITVFAVAFRPNILHINYIRKNNISLSRFLVFSTLIFSLTIFSDHDYFAYWEELKSPMFRNNTRLESIYVKIGLFWNQNYILYRLTIWGGALWAFCKTSRLLKLNLSNTLFILFACYCVTFSYARASLGMAIAFLGYSIYYLNRKKNQMFSLAGIGVLMSSVMFHSSLILLIAVILGMPHIRFSKKWIPLYILMIPVIYIGCRFFYEYMLASGGLMDEQTSDKLQHYTEKERASANLFGMFRMIFDYGAFYVPVFICVKKVLFEKNRQNISDFILNLTKITFGIIIISTFFLSLNLPSLVLVYRTMYMTLIPLTFIITYLYRENILSKKDFKICIWFGIISNLYGLSYSVYGLLK